MGFDFGFTLPEPITTSNVNSQTTNTREQVEILCNETELCHAIVPCHT